LIRALKNLARSFQGMSVLHAGAMNVEEIEHSAIKIAHEYYSSDDEIRRRARDKVARWGSPTIRSSPRR
jgi:hypothetical protein